MDEHLEEYLQAVNSTVSEGKKLTDEQVWLDLVKIMLSDPQASTVEYICQSADKFLDEFHTRFR